MMMAGRNHKNTPSVCLTHLLLISVFFLGIFFPAPAWGAVSEFAGWHAIVLFFRNS